MPRFSDDDVMDFMVTEAIVARAVQEEQGQQEKSAKDREMAAWKAGAATELPG